jgi:hypothetical protein
VYLWVAITAWGTVRLFLVLIEWCALIRYEQVRASSLVTVLRATPAGSTVRDDRADGTVLQIGFPDWPMPRSAASRVRETAWRYLADR